MSNLEIKPQPGPQEEFFKTKADICIYGGAAGAGKTFALLLEPLRHYENKKFGAVIFRRTSKQVKNEGGLWDTSVDLYAGVKGHPRESVLDWTFPSGSSVTFAHLEYDKNVLDWQGSAIALLCFDELTHFTEKQFWYMLSRNRSTSGVRPYVRATTNPDSRSWVRKFIDWFIDDLGFPIPERSGKLRWFIRREDTLFWDDTKEALLKRYPGSLPKSLTFIPGKLSDNQILERQDPGYRANLEALSKVERGRLLDGNWNIEPTAGMLFKKHYFEEVKALPVMKRIVRGWDRAATEKTASNNPDWTAGVKLGQDADGIFYIMDIEREQFSPLKVERLIKNTAKHDGRKVIVKAFQDPGGAGVTEIDAFVRSMAGFIVKTEKINVDKVTAAKSCSAQAEAGNIKIYYLCKHKDDFLAEAENFPEGSNDDMVDGLTSAFNELTSDNTGDFSDAFDQEQETISEISLTETQW